MRTGGGSLEEKDDHEERQKWMESKHVLEAVSAALVMMQWINQGFGAGTGG